MSYRRDFGSKQIEMRISTLSHYVFTVAHYLVLAGKSRRRRSVMAWKKKGKKPVEKKPVEKKPEEKK